ncbi:MAG: helix-turn-helix domain-containing protein [Mycobacterium sp.]|nr:helix-turn-helix domain-containing protein [Mycobacterium sp.]
MSTVASGSWIRQIRPDSAAVVKPVSAPELLARATEQLGSEPVAWAVEFGYDLATQSVEKFPELGSAAAQLNRLRLGCESITITAMLMLDSGGLVRPETPADTLRGLHDYVYRGIPLTTVWKSMQLGHSLLSKALMAACRLLTEDSDQPRLLQRVSEILFDYVNSVFDDISEAYTAEHERRMLTTAEARGRAITALLNHSAVDIGAAEALLRYSLAHRTHLGTVVWLDEASVADEMPLHEVARMLLDGAGSKQTLVMPQGPLTVHGWGNSAGEFDLDGLRAVLDGHPGVRCAFGRVGLGVDGFVRSHHEAADARQVADALPAVAAPTVPYVDVRHLRLVVDDVSRVDRFVTEVLGPLADDDRHHAELRTTASAYLRLRRSPLAVAKELHLVRNTVGYRLKKVEELLGRSLDDSTLQTWLALELKNASGEPHP